MSLNILRWRGGYAGDMTLRMILDSNPGARSNVGIKDMNDFGGMILTAATTGTELDSLLESPAGNPDIDIVALRKEIDRLRHSSDQWFLKSHYYGSPEFNDITVDIVADRLSLPFVIKSNISKCPPPAIDGKLNSMIKDDAVREKYYLYILARECLDGSPIGDRHIDVSTIISGHDQLSVALSEHAIKLDASTEHFYQTWVDRNNVNFPTNRYVDNVRKKNYDYLDSSLSIPERYSLLAQSGNKFKILD